MARIIGFIGYAGAGKDTAAHAILKEYRRQGRKACMDGFAMYIREISSLVGLDPFDRQKKEVRCRIPLWLFSTDLQYAIDFVLGHKLTEHERAELYAFTVDALEDFIDAFSGSQVIDISPREFMQVLGTEGGQQVRPTLWAELAASRWSKVADTVLVPDVRFAHELPYLDTLILVWRPGYQRVNKHASERLVERITQGEDIQGTDGLQMITLPNDTGLGRLEWRAETLAQHFIREDSIIDSPSD